MGWIVKSLVTSVLGFTAFFAVLSSANMTEPTASTSFIKLEEIKPKKTDKLTGEWRFTIGGRGQHEGKDEGVASFLFLDTRVQYKLIDSLKVVFHPRLDLYSSRVEERIDDDTYQSKLRLLDAYVQYSPWQELALSGGTFAQGSLRQPMLISKRRSFPGAQEVFEVEAGVRFSATAQQLVPTSTSLNTERAEQEGMPTFLTESFSVGNLQSEKNYLWTINVGHYSFKNLPSETAFKSNILGNQVEGDSVTNSRFRFGFDGWFAGVEGCFCAIDGLKLNSSFQRLHNSLASSTAADGQAWTFAPTLVYKDFDVSLAYWSYFVESDATVALQTAGSTNGTNRIGQEIKLALDLKKLGFSVETSWGQAQPINQTLVQQTFTEYYIGLESHYVAF